MQVPVLATRRLVLLPLVSADAEAIQQVFPRWEIVKHLAAGVPWPYPEEGARHYVDQVALPSVAAGNAWFWTLRRKEDASSLIGLICLTDAVDNNRGFWLVPEWQRRGYMTEAAEAVTDYWFNTLDRQVLRTPKARENLASRRLSIAAGMHLVRSEQKEYVGGWYESELWEITREQWNQRHDKTKKRP